MSDFMMMEPSNCSFQELLSNGVRYSVPRFQRDYAWQIEQWEDLWSDIETLEEEKYHYIGYIVLQRKGQNQFDIIDGQQRLVTLSLLVLAALKRIQNFIDSGNESEHNSERLEELRRSFIGNKDTVTLRTENKLHLNRNNDRYFKAISADLDVPVRRKSTSTNKLLQKCFEFFYDKMSFNSGSKVAAKIAQISQGIMFTKIVVQDDLNAYKVFETLNARGVQLSTPDLIKNYIFSVITQNDDVPDEELDELDIQWGEIIQELGEIDFTEFVRYHHNVQAPLSTKKSLFKSVRNLINNPAAARQYLKSLTAYAAVYGALLNPYDDFWHEKFNGESHKELQNYLEGFKLFGIKQPFSILMAAYFKFTSDEFLLLTKYLYILSIRYNIVGKGSPNIQEHINNRIAMAIYNGTLTRASHIKNHEDFRKLYTKDADFINQFALFSLPTRQSSKKVRFLLANIENYLGQSCDYNQCILEHVCPYQVTEEWQTYFGEGVNDIQDRLGNVVLLSEDKLKRADFETKKQNYAESPYKLAQKVAEYEDWNLASVNHYQMWLAEQAVKTWRVDYE